MNNFYNYIYGTLYKYYESLWGKEKDIIPFNVTLGLSFSFIAFIISIALLLFIFFNINLLFLFSNKLIMFSLLSSVVGFHYFQFEHHKKYEKIMADYNKERKKEDNHSFKKTLVFVYIFGSIISLISLAILSTVM